MKGLTNFIFTFLLKSSFYFTQSIPTRIFFPYKSVMLVSIYLLKLKIKPPVLTQNPQDTLHSLSCVNICTKDPPLKIFFKIMLDNRRTCFHITLVLPHRESPLDTLLEHIIPVHNIVPKKPKYLYPLNNCKTLSNMFSL